jgi:hypothetical protein
MDYVLISDQVSTDCAVGFTTGAEARRWALEMKLTDYVIRPVFPVAKKS